METMDIGKPVRLCAVTTVILLNKGRKAIEDIVVGDYVWAWDEETGEKSLRRVTETYVNQTSELVHVFVGGEEIITTPTHPFYSPVKGWTEACQLRAGDILVLVNGEYVVVEKVQHEILECPINVYNFQVAGDHTYYVSDIGVLVHNACRNPYGKKGSPAHQRVIQEAKAHFEQLGYEVYEEVLIKTPGGYKNKRFVDLLVTDGIHSFGIQVGRNGTRGFPVARELRAIADLIDVLEAVFFIAYN